MAEYICLFNKDTLIIKPAKKSPILLRMVVLVFAMVCGVYICSVCLKQISTTSNIKIEDIQVIERPEPVSPPGILQIPVPHFPHPNTFSRAECGHNPVRYFAILSMQRSGSGWFETLLNSHINVSSNGEIFSVLDRRRNASSVIETLDKVYNLDWFTSASKNECSAAVGFKWMLNQGLMEHHEEIVQYFNSKGVSAIFLFRRNLLRRMVSVLANSYDRYAKLLNGTHKSHVHSPEEAETLSKYKPIINSTLLIDNIKEVEIIAAKALAYYNSTRHITLYYEDLIKNHTKLEDVQEFLGLPVTKLTSRQVKIHKGPLSDHIKNWEDVNKTLTGTAYESFLMADY
ncbi:P-loop containing nucleoside triphosphate hydrolases superfamily protein [Euphorbia peplus]|nr:P-loop containing nucleoside triphosphate hydrolases superfamily protein [Euphorbia peplus]